MEKKKTLEAPFIRLDIYHLSLSTDKDNKLINNYFSASKEILMHGMAFLYINISVSILQTIFQTSQLLLERRCGQDKIGRQQQTSSKRGIGRSIKINQASQHKSKIYLYFIHLDEDYSEEPAVSFA